MTFSMSMSAEPEPTSGRDEAWPHHFGEKPQRNPAGADSKTTRWSVILHSDHSDKRATTEAVKRLYQLFWYPIYSRARRHGYTPEMSLEVVHQLFTGLVDRNPLAWPRTDTKRFRSFLLSALSHLLSGDRQTSHGVKRARGIPGLSLDATLAEERYLLEAKDDAPPDQLFEKQWALSVLQTVSVQLEAECSAEGKGADFAVLKSFLPGNADTPTYSAAADQLQQSEGSLRVAVHRLQERYRDLLRGTIRDTVDEAADVDDEIRYLIRCLRGVH